MTIWKFAKRKVKIAAWKAIQRAGYSVRKNESDAFPDQLRLTEKLEVQTVFDLGANCGDTVLQYRKGFPQAKIFAFEPIPDLAEQLKKRVANDEQCVVETLAVAEKVGTAKFNLNAAIDTSSLLASDLNNVPESYRTLQETVRVLEVRTTSIDSYCDEFQIKNIDILKLDIQGGELSALQGAERMLRSQSIALIYTEVFFLPFYQHHPLFSEIFAQLSKFGYSLHSLYNLSFRSTSGRCSWADAIFVSSNLRHTSLELLSKDTNA